MFLNKVFILGNLTSDPDIRSLPNGQLVANFRLATNRFYIDKEGKKQQTTEFHNVVAFGKNAEIIQQYLKKGSLALIEGHLRTRSWEDPSGNKHYRTEIIVERLQLGPKGVKIETSKEEPKEEIPIIEEEEEIDIEDIPF